MNAKEAFLDYIYQKHQAVDQVPSNDTIAAWAVRVINTLFPQRLPHCACTKADIEERLEALERALVEILETTHACADCDKRDIARRFFTHLPELEALMRTDVDAILNGDPAARSAFEIIRTYPGFFTIALYRVAHSLHVLDIPLIPRILTEHAHSLTGIDIHPGAVIGPYFFIDHGTGIVIGETTRVGAHVKIYQGVTLGALSVDKNLANVKRHPTLEDHVIVYAGATILGGETRIGKNSIIGGNVWLTRSIPANARVYHQATVKVVEPKNSKE